MFVIGIGALLLTLAGFSLFSLKFPRGDKAMEGLADAAVATFLVEAIFMYICGDFVGIPFLREVGAASGGMGAVAAAALVGLSMGTHPVYAIASAAAVAGFGILPGFIAAYFLHFIMKKTVKYLPAGLDVIIGTLMAAGIARGIAAFVDPAVNKVISTIVSCHGWHGLVMMPDYQVNTKKARKVIPSSIEHDKACLQVA